MDLPRLDVKYAAAMDERERELRREDLDPDPVREFGVWYEHARASGVPMPEAAAIATASPDGRPAARMVLLKSFDGRGFVFATNYESRKGVELAQNGRAAMLFYWHTRGQQVRVEGGVERVAPQESDAIWLDRPRASRISALASRQSQVGERSELESRVSELEAHYGGREVERPAWWGGYRLVPDELEFWQHRENRLHHRFRYRRRGDSWEIDELQP
jgi:pyridoxamine 5'-phosphate oxidase